MFLGKTHGEDLAFGVYSLEHRGNLLSTWIWSSNCVKLVIFPYVETNSGETDKKAELFPFEIRSPAVSIEKR